MPDTLSLEHHSKQLVSLFGSMFTFCVHVHCLGEVNCSNIEGFPLIGLVGAENLGFPSKVCCSLISPLFYLCVYVWFRRSLSVYNDDFGKLVLK